MGDGDTEKYYAYTRFCIFQLGKLVVSGVFHRRYIIKQLTARIWPLNLCKRTVSTVYFSVHGVNMHNVLD